MEKPQPEPGNTSPDVELVTHSSEAPSGVRRVNNVPLLIAGGVLVVFVILVAMVASQRGEQEEAEPAVSAGMLPENSQLLDQMLANGALAGLVPDADADRMPSFPVARVSDPDSPPVPGDATAAVGIVRAEPDQAARERMKLFQTATQAKTGIGKLADASVTPQVDKKEKKSDQDDDSLGDLPRDQRVPVAADGDYSKFDRAHGADGKRQDRWLLDSDVETPRTAYELRAGSVIPATMISGINSDLPGQITAQISQDVFDTPTGRHRLIPQGSKLVGRYSHNVVMGQSRVLVAWQRIVFPDGKAFDIGSMGGADSAGYAGFEDQVDRHYVRVFGSAILMSGIAAGLTSSRVSPENDPYGSSNAATLSQTTAQQIGEVASKMIERNLDIAPTLKIRPGYRFNVTAVKDLTFDRPYQPFDY